MGQQNMAKEVSLTIGKILNWSQEQESCRVEVAFYGVNSGAYLSHKTAVGYASQHALVLNSSFKIEYNPRQHLVSCKLTQLDAEGGSQAIGTLEIDLELLAERSLLFLPFQEHDKVLEIKLYEQQREGASNSSTQTKLQREEFLNKRFEFMDRITAHETELKKKFSERVYNFLKELKNRNFHEGERDPSRNLPLDPLKNQKGKNQLEFRSRLTDEKRKIYFGSTDFFGHPEQGKDSPAKLKEKQDLLIHSYRAISLESEGRQGSQKEAGVREEKGGREDYLEVQSRKGPFGGLLNNYGQE